MQLANFFGVFAFFFCVRDTLRTRADRTDGVRLRGTTVPPSQHELWTTKTVQQGPEAFFKDAARFVLVCSFHTLFNNVYEIEGLSSLLS